MNKNSKVDGPICWICGAAANSREHRLKKSDIVRAYGRGPYLDDDGPLHYRSDVQTLLQGPNSSVVKYAPIMCHTCNTALSQPFDNAYDLFISWVLDNEEIVLGKRFVNFENVFGVTFEEDQRNLFKYFAKSFGCRVVEAGRAVPNDVVELLLKSHFQTGLRITFSVNEDILLLPKTDRNSFIGKADFGVMVSKKNPSEVTGYIWREHVSWFNVNYWYLAQPEGDLGSIWMANSQHIYLGSFAPLSSEERADLKEKVALMEYDNSFPASA